MLGGQCPFSMLGQHQVYLLQHWHAMYQQLVNCHLLRQYKFHGQEQKPHATSFLQKLAPPALQEGSSKHSK